MLLDELDVRLARERHERLRREVEWEHHVKAALAGQGLERVGLAAKVQTWADRAQSALRGMAGKRERVHSVEAAHAEGGLR